MKLEVRREVRFETFVFVEPFLDFCIAFVIALCTIITINLFNLPPFLAHDGVCVLNYLSSNYHLFDFSRQLLTFGDVFSKYFS